MFKSLKCSLQNLYDSSPVFLVPFAFNSTLGGVIHDSSGAVVGAETVRMLWMVEMNTANITVVDERHPLVKYPDNTTVLHQVINRTTLQQICIVFLSNTS
jgi:hypothetical protein